MIYLTAIVLIGLFAYLAAGPAPPDHALKKRADAGDPAAQLLYSNRLADAYGSQTPESLKYLKLAVEQQYPEADTMYAILLATGKGIPENREEAGKYFKRAASHGHEVARTLYAQFLELQKVMKRAAL
jgi:TPR repeat protein